MALTLSLTCLVYPSVCARMGAGSSKPPATTPAPAVVDLSRHDTVNESSSGFHFFELHFPSVGASIGVFILIAILIGGAYLLYVYCRAKAQKIQAASAAAASAHYVAANRAVSLNTTSLPYALPAPSPSAPDFQQRLALLP